VTKTVAQAVEELVRATVGLSDEDMGRTWKWGDYDDEGLRFALLLTHHELRDLAVRLAARRRTAPRQAELILAQYHQTYRDLTGVLAGVRTEDLDRAPADGEWPLRETLKHLLRAEHGFLARIRFALEHPPTARLDSDGDAEFLAFRKERYDVPEDATTGPTESIRNRFFEVHRRVLTELADVTDAQLEIRSWFWESEPMPIRFRMHRIEEHLRQHIIQLDKTLAAIRPPTEAHRLVRNVYNALADVESAPDPAEDLRAEAARVISARAAAIAA
jgi:uncharacterized damage-inducible protein DinB